MGIVINNSDEASASDGYRGYGYYRYGRYASRYYRKGTRSRDRNKSDSTPVLVSGRGETPIRKAEVIVSPENQEASVE